MSGRRRCLIGATTIVLACVSISPTAHAGIDELYVRPGSKGWGHEVLERFLGHRGFGKSYAVIVGIGNYAKYPKLSAPADDAKRVRDFLKQEALFDHVVTLTDEKATKQRIEALMEDELPKLVRSNDRVLFYFSGHGVTRPVTSGKRGYLVLGSAEVDQFNDMISMARVREWSENLGQVRHSLFLLDACFSGLFSFEFKGGDQVRKRTIERLMQPAHHLVTAGTEGETSIIFNDRSLFTDAFLAAARGHIDLPEDGVLSLTDMMSRINRTLDQRRAEIGERVHMTPRQYQMRNSNNGGEFFFLPAARSTPQKAVQPQSSGSIQKKDGNAISDKPIGPSSMDEPHFVAPSGNDRIPPLLRAAYDDLVGKRYRSGIDKYSNVLSTDPTNVEALYNRGWMYAQLSEHAQAVADFDAVIRLKPSHVSAWKSRAVSQYELRNYAQAIQDNDVALRLDPQSSGTYQNRAAAYVASGKPQLALVDYDQALRLDPRLSIAWLGRGMTKMRLQQFEGAIADFSEGIRRDPTNVATYSNRAEAYRAKGAFDLAISDFSTVIRLNPAEAAAHDRRGDVYVEKRDYENAIKDYNEAIKLDSKNANFFESRGIAYHHKGDFDAAIQDYNTAVRLAPRDANALSNRATSYYAKGDMDAALRDYSAALEIDGNHVGARSGRGATFATKGDPKRSIEDYTRAIELKPSDVTSYLGRAAVHYNRGDFDQAIADYDAALRLDPVNTTALNYRGAAKQKNGDTAGAAADLASARRIVRN